MRARDLHCVGVLLLPVAVSAQLDFNELHKRIRQFNKLMPKCREGKEKECDKLLKYARTDAELEVRALATMRLMDPAVLAEIVESDPEWSVRRAAAANEHLTDPVLLARVATEDEASDVRRAAVARISNSTVLARVAHKDEVDWVREEAVKSEHLTDQAVLAAVAAGDPERRVRLAALEKVTDPAAFDAIARTAEHKDVRDAAIRKLPDDLLAAIAEAAEVPEARRAATMRLAAATVAGVLGSRPSADRQAG
jgi:hypothetical protein